MINHDTHSELLLGFLEESIEALDTAGVLAVRLEDGRTDTALETIGAIFRPIHSLKGNAAYFGLLHLKKFAHSLENILDVLRKGERKTDSGTVNLILSAIDHLKLILSNVRAGKDEIDDVPAHERLAADLNVWLTNEINRPVVKDPGNVRALLQKIRDVAGEQSVQFVRELETYLLGTSDTGQAVTEKKGEDKALLTGGQTVPEYELLLKIVGEQSEYPLPERSARRLDKIVKGIRSKVTDEDEIKKIEEIDETVTAFRNSDAGIDSMAGELIRSLVHGAGKKMTEKPAPQQENVVPAENAAAVSSVKALKAEKTMRIPEQTLDDFLYGVGELLGIEEMLRYLLRMVHNGADNEQIAAPLKEAFSQFTATSKDLRQRIMAVRRVEARPMLQKTVRVVHDIAAVSGKKIKTVVTGDDLMIDKSYLELLDAPLTHLVRNAADHGIELPQLREAAGKDPEGTVTVELRESTEMVHLTVKDDGSGLNYDALKNKGIELGLIGKNELMTHESIVELLFRSGVSTAEKVTEISGRGVGMDVVRQAVDNAGGTITVDDIPQNGCTVTISVPRNASTQILDGYIIRAFSGELYAVPLSNVVDAFVIEKDMITRLAGKRRTVMHRGGVLPLYTIDTVLSRATVKRPAGAGASSLMGVVVEWKKKNVVFAVKELVGIQKIVCKPVEKRIIQSRLFDGAAISGTGQISMILNVEELFTDLRNNKGKTL